MKQLNQSWRHYKHTSDIWFDEIYNKFFNLNPIYKKIILVKGQLVYPATVLQNSKFVCFRFAHRDIFFSAMNCKVARQFDGCLIMSETKNIYLNVAPTLFIIRRFWLRIFISWKRQYFETNSEIEAEMKNRLLVNRRNKITFFK